MTAPLMFRWVLPILLVIAMNISGLAQQSPATLSDSHRTWLAIVPKLHKLAEDQKQILVKATEAITSDVIQCKSNTGIERFIEDATSLRSKGMRLTDPNGHKRWLRQQFQTHVIPVTAIHTVMIAHSRSVDQSLAALDENLLIELKADVSLDPSTIRCAAIDVAVINSEIDKVASEIYAQVDQATAKQIAAFLAGTAGFEAGRRITRSAMQDEQGSVSLIGELFSFAVGMATDEITSRATNHVLGTKQELSNSLHSLANQVINGCIGEGDAATVLVNEYTGAVRNHQMAVVDALIKSLGIDRDWAYAQF